MTGAGSGELLFCRETELAGSLVDADGESTPDSTGFGRDPSLTELDLQNQLERLRDDNSVWSVESVKQNFNGAVSVEATVAGDVHDEVEKFVFNDGGTAMQAGLANSIRIFTGVNFAGGSAERILKGAIPLSYDISYNQGEMVTYSLSMAYADEEPATSVDLSSANRPSEGESVAFHGFELQIDGGTVVEDLQSCTLSISEIARFQRGTSPTPNRGVIAAPSATLDATALFTTPSRLDIARGDATGGLPDTLDSVTGTITLTSQSGTVSTYNLNALKPDSYSWENVISTENTADTTTFNIDGGVTVS